MNAKMKACGVCKREIAKSATTCPHCGDAPNAGGRVLLVLVAVVLVLVIGWQVLAIF